MAFSLLDEFTNLIRLVEAADTPVTGKRQQNRAKMRMGDRTLRMFVSSPAILLSVCGIETPKTAKNRALKFHKNTYLKGSQMT
jgi:hypothetical protein